MARKLDNNRKIPKVLEKCIDFISTHGKIFLPWIHNVNFRYFPSGLESEGIFRVPGSSLEVEAYKSAFDLTEVCS